MVNSEENHSVNDRRIDDLGHMRQADESGRFDDSSSSTGVSDASMAGSSTRSRSTVLTERLTEILVEERDADLLIQRSGGEESFMQWLRALDMQVMGACRADERLKPLLKLNVSTGASDDLLLAHLSQHFELSEVGRLARCLCVPLVSIRVGKINKQGTLLCPTAARGSLNLALLPTSDLRFSFVGDNGRTEKVATVHSESQCSAVIIEEILEDRSGRSFLLNIPDGETFYFWCSEKSKLLGNELLRKMKTLLSRKPSLAELTGISESRLASFSVQLRGHLVGSVATKSQTGSALSATCPSDSLGESSEVSLEAQSSSVSQKSLRSRHSDTQVTRVNPTYQGSLSPRSGSFKEGVAKHFLRNLPKERLRDVASTGRLDVCGSTFSDKGKLPEGLSQSSGLLEALVTDPLVLGSGTTPPMDSSLFSPYYCLCPPSGSTLKYSVGTPQLPISSTESLSLPPLSTLLSAARSSSHLNPNPPVNAIEASCLDFPPLPLARYPLSMSASQQIPTFTPLMCDAIVHIPVIEVCSSGQGYLVSAGPGISTPVPPLLPSLVSPLIPNSESMVDKGARETLRFLINSSNHPSPQLLDVFPSAFTSCDEKPNVFAAGSRGLYSGTSDIDAISNGITTIGFVPPPEGSFWGDSIKRCTDRADFSEQTSEPAGGSGFSYDDKMSKFREENAD